MRPPITDAWGKLRKDDLTGQVTAWHPLIAHCADVASCTEALLTKTLLGKRLARLRGAARLGAAEIHMLCLLSALHDLGKPNRGFQAKAEPSPAFTAGHVSEAIGLFFDGRVNPSLVKALDLVELARCFADPQDLLRLLVASVSHHGRPVAWTSVGDHSLWDPKAFSVVERLAIAARGWFPRATDSAMPRVSTEFQHAFSGLVMLADWLGSDTTIFPYSEDHQDRMPFARAQASLAVARLGLDADVARAALGEKPPGFEVVFGFAPREAQAKVIATELHGEGSLVVLESETGSGKTEAAVAHYLRLFHGGLVDGMMFALPTRTAATQLHARVVKAVAAAFPDAVSRPPVTLAVPGYLQVDDVDGRRLPGFEVLWNDDDKERFRFRGWASEQPKRYLAGAIVVGTVDQLLLSAVRVSHAHLRATSSLRHLLVIDEVHASDSYMLELLREVLVFHARAGGHAFLMSATFGARARERIEAAVLGLRRDERVESSYETARAIPYPAIHRVSLGPGAARETVAVANAGLPKRVAVQLSPIADDPAAIAKAATAAARAGARVLVLRNTVRSAIETQLELERLVGVDDPILFRVCDVVSLHHSRFSRDDRIALDHAVEARLGRGGPQTGGCVVVSTQTIQQSLDLDADFMLTDLCPMDVLLQRIGRVHRHKERDPHRSRGYELPQTLVLTREAPLDEALTKYVGHGIGLVYENVVILAATQRRIQEQPLWSIPEDNRDLVECTVHPDALKRLAAELGTPWQEHLAEIEGKATATRGVAATALVERNEPFGLYEFTDHGSTERVSSRLGESARRVVFATPYPVGPFGRPVRELQIPAWMVREAEPSDEVVPARGSVSPFEFEVGSTTFEYGRLGLMKKLK